MKKISILFLAFFALFSFSSCTSDDDVVFVAQPDAEGIQFSNTFQNMYVLPTGNPDNLAERFVWNEVDFSAPTTITYELQASAKESFEELMVIGTTDANNLGVTNGQMKELAADAGLDNDPETDVPNTGMVYFKVRAFAGEGEGNALEEFSDTVSVTVQLQEATDGGDMEELPKLYVVGSFLEAGGYGANWNAGDAVPMAASAVGKTDFEGFVYMNVETPEFKFLPTNEGFDGDYGDTGETNGSYNGTLEQEDEVNAGTPEGTSGYFLVNADTDALTYKLTQTDWAVIGNGTPKGWDEDTDMTYDAENKVWTVTLDLTAGADPDEAEKNLRFKFRANHAWDINLGTGDGENNLSFGGADIDVPETGNYTITLDLSNPRMYTYSLVKN